MLREEDIPRHEQWSGLRNTVKPEHFALDDLDAATNFDIDDAKRLHRRTGHGSAVVSGAVRSLWAKGSVALAVRNDTTLVRILPDYSLATLRSGLTPGLDMSYDELGGRVYYSNGVETGAVDNGTDRTWGLAVPAAQPVAEAIGGTLPAGIYQFAVTFLRSDGQESGTQRAGTIELTMMGGIRLTSLPTTDDADVSLICVYFTKTNGDTLYRVGLIDTDAGDFDYPAEASMQVPLTTQHLRPAPAGQIVRVHNGRTLVASGNTLRYSEPYAPELFDLRKGYTFLDEVVMLEPLENGVWLGTKSEVLWLEGADIQKAVLRQRLSYGAIRGAATRCSRDMVLDGQGSAPVAVFATKYGVCLGDERGQALNLTQDRFVYPIQERGTALVRRHRGMSQAVVTLRGAETAAPAAL